MKPQRLIELHENVGRDSADPVPKSLGCNGSDLLACAVESTARPVVAADKKT